MDRGLPNTGSAFTAARPSVIPLAVWVIWIALQMAWSPLPSPGIENVSKPCNNTLKLSRSGDTLTMDYLLRDANGNSLSFKKSDLRGEPGFKVMYRDRLLASGTFSFG